MSEWKNDNPLLFTGGLPPFDEVKAEHVVPAVESLIAELEAELEALEENVGPHWEESVVPIELMGDRLGRCWGVVGHLMGVRNEEALREAYEAAQPVVVQFSLRLGQSENIHRALLELSESEEAKALSGAQQRILESLLREAKHSGVALAGESRERFNGIAQELAQLSTDFSNRVLDATEAGGLL